MLYTAMPLERIYKNFYAEEKEISEKEIEGKKEFCTKYGTVTARKHGEQYVVESLYSTDMADYLNMKYCPGVVIEGQQEINLL